MEKAIISIIMPSYNRAKTLPRAIESVLRQDYPDWELIIVDDGSTDNTVDVLAMHNDSRIHIFYHNKNRGITAALNTGLDVMQGGWFTRLDSDDEVMPHAFSTMLQVSREIDPRINAVSCNCIDSSTGGFSGTGLNKDQYLDAKTIVRYCRGEHWGITKTLLLEGERFKEELKGWEGVLWHEINKRAHRYYIHKGLRLYHTEGSDRESKSSEASDGRRLRQYQGYLALLKETEYLEDYRKWGQDFYRDIFFNAGICFIRNGDKKHALYCLGRLLSTRESCLKILLIMSGIIAGNKAIDALRYFKNRYFHFKLS